MLAVGADKNKANKQGVAPILLACASGNIKLARLLLEAGADKDKANNYNNRGHTSLLYVCKQGNVEIVQLMLEAGVDKDKTINKE